jgi:hypothetical protein
MTASKAVAGGVAANLVTIGLWLLAQIPGWATIPDEPKAAIIALASAAIGAVVVYFAPANRQTVDAPSNSPVGLLEQATELR